MKGCVTGSSNHALTSLHQALRSGRFGYGNALPAGARAFSTGARRSFSTTGAASAEKAAVNVATSSDDETARVRVAPALEGMRATTLSSDVHAVSSHAVPPPRACPLVSNGPRLAPSSARSLRPGLAPTLAVCVAGTVARRA